MNCRTVGLVFFAAIFAAINLSITTPAQTTPFTKPQVADRIRKVEDGVDEFQKYLENCGQDANNRAETAQSNGATTLLVTNLRVFVASISLAADASELRRAPRTPVGIRFDFKGASQ
jgi:hypothetical protein